MTPDYSSDRLRRLLAEAELSQCGAARELGVSPRAMRYWCAGKNPIPRMLFLALAYIIDNTEE